MVVGGDETFGIISDIDDTVISTSLPRPMIAAWNTFVRAESARHVVPGMATMYRELLDEHPGAPIVYVSTGAWNTAPHADPVPAPHGYPAGPAAAHRLGADQLRVVPVGAGAQAGLPAPAGQRVPPHPVAARRRRRPARPEDLRRLRRAAPGPGRGHRDPRAHAQRAGALARHPGVQRGARARRDRHRRRCRCAARPTATACCASSGSPSSADVRRPVWTRLSPLASRRRLLPGRMASCRSCPRCRRSSTSWPSAPTGWPSPGSSSGRSRC